MATSILATANTAADSADTAIAAGTPVALKGVVDGAARVLIYPKNDASGYTLFSELTSHRPGTLLSGAGTYRFSRVAGGTCGVFSG